MTSTAATMTPSRPYLVRAIYDWILDNQLTPHIVVDAAVPGVQVPPASVKDGQVVLNIAPRAVAQLELGNDQVRFLARFGGVSHDVRVPIGAVLAVYAVENGQGMMFPAEQSAESVQTGPDEAPSTGDETSVPKRGRPSLRVVK